MKEVAIVFNVPEELRKQIKICATMNGMTMKELLIKAIERYIQEEYGEQDQDRLG